MAKKIQRACTNRASTATVYYGSCSATALAPQLVIGARDSGRGPGRGRPGALSATQQSLSTPTKGCRSALYPRDRWRSGGDQEFSDYT